MGYINIRIPDELDEKIRQIAARKYGFRKGSLKKAIIEALEEWIRKNEEDEGSNF